MYIFDPQEEEKRAEELGAIAPPAPPPAATTAPPPAAAQAPASPAPPADDHDAWGALGDTIKTVVSAPGKAIGDEGAAWGALLDVALNRGRGVGQIIAAGARERAKRGDRDLERQYKQAQIAELGRRHTADDAEYKRQLLEARKGELDARGQSLQLQREGMLIRLSEAKRRNDEYRAKYDKDDPGMVALIDGLSSVMPRADVEAILGGASMNTADKLMPIINEKYKQTPASQRAAAERAAAEAGARRVATGEDVRDAAAEQRRDAQAKREARAAELAEAAAIRADRKEREGRYGSFRDDTKFTARAITEARGADEVLSKYPEGDQPGVGTIDSWISGRLSSTDALKVRRAMRVIADYNARVVSGAAIPPPEYERLIEFVDAGKGATERQFRVAWNATRHALRAEARRQAVGREDIAREILGPDAAWALDDTEEEAGAQPAAATPTTPDRAAPRSPPQQQELPLPQPEPTGPTGQAEPQPNHAAYDADALVKSNIKNQSELFASGRGKRGGDTMTPVFMQAVPLGREGRVYLLPASRPDGTEMTEDEAVQQFYRTNKHFGIYEDGPSAYAAAEKVIQAATTPVTQGDLPIPSEVVKRPPAAAQPRAHPDDSFKGYQEAPPSPRASRVPDEVWDQFTDEERQGFGKRGEDNLETAAGTMGADRLGRLSHDELMQIANRGRAGGAKSQQRAPKQATQPSAAAAPKAAQPNQAAAPAPTSTKYKGMTAKKNPDGTYTLHDPNSGATKRIGADQLPRFIDGSGKVIP